MTGKDFTGTIWAAEHPADAASHIRYLVQILAERDATIATLERELERLAGDLARAQIVPGSVMVPPLTKPGPLLVHWYTSGPAFACGYRPQDHGQSGCAKSTTTQPEAVTCPACQAVIDL